MAIHNLVTFDNQNKTMICIIVFSYTKIIHSNKEETADFHDTVSFDPVKMLQQK